MESTAGQQRQPTPPRQLPLACPFPIGSQAPSISTSTAPLAQAFLHLRLSWSMDSISAAGNLLGMMMSSGGNCNSSGSRCEDDCAREKKRRFSEAQVRSMEVMFETQAKLEPRKKQQLAKELGLQPRQVAIWFQNKRARWKSKELERAYAALSADYDTLRSSFDALLHQKNALSMQVQRLVEMLETTAPPEKKESGESSVREGEAGLTPMLSLSSRTNNSEEETKMKIAFEGEEVENHMPKSIEHRGGRSLASSENEQQFCIRNAGYPLDHMIPGGGCSQWWEFLAYE